MISHAYLEFTQFVLSDVFSQFHQELLKYWKDSELTEAFLTLEMTFIAIMIAFQSFPYCSLFNYTTQVEEPHKCNSSQEELKSIKFRGNRNYYSIMFNKF
jgi:hypothetical protein